MVRNLPNKGTGAYIGQARVAHYPSRVRFEALIEGVLMASLDSMYTQVWFNLISVRVCVPSFKGHNSLETGFRSLRTFGVGSMLRIRNLLKQDLIQRHFSI